MTPLSPIRPSPNRFLSIILTSLAIVGSNSIWESMCFSRSIPGAISLSSRPSSVSLKTALSVMYMTSWPFSSACFPLKVICSISFLNFFDFPSLTMLTLPSLISTWRPPAVKVPQYTTLFVDCEMSMNPPQPGILGPNLDTLTSPQAPGMSHQGNPNGRSRTG